MNNDNQYETPVVTNTTDVSNDELNGLDERAAAIIRRAKKENAKSCNVTVTVLKIEIILQ